jgi:hypothetical protein
MEDLRYADIPESGANLRQYGEKCTDSVKIMYLLDSTGSKLGPESVSCNEHHDSRKGQEFSSQVQ